MLTHEFEFDGILCQIRAANPRRDEWDKALIVRKLAQVYGDVSIDLQSATAIADGVQSATSEGAMGSLVRMFSDPALEAAFSIHGAVTGFAALAPRVVSLVTDELKGWIKASDPASKIDAAFQHYLDHAAFWVQVEQEIAALDRPNGVEGAPADQLTDEEKADPKSQPAGESGSSDS